MPQPNWWEGDQVVSAPPAAAPEAFPGVIPGRPKTVDPIEEERLRLAQDTGAREAERLRIAQEDQARQKAQFEGTGGIGSQNQQQIATLLTRIAGGASDINAIAKADPGAQAPGFVENLRGDLMPGGVAGLATRAIAGPHRRTVADAQRDMLDAMLTLGTGAAYAKEQLSGQMAAYFPQYNDTPQEIATKNQRLLRLIEAAKANAGPAWVKVAPAIEPFMQNLQVEPPASKGDEGWTPEKSSALWGRVVFDAKGKPLGPDGGEGFDEKGEPLGFFGATTDDSPTVVDPAIAAEAARVDKVAGQMGAFDLAQHGLTLGLTEDAAGAGKAIAEAIRGDFNLAGNYTLGRNAEKLRVDQARQRLGWAGTAAELAGGFALPASALGRVATIGEGARGGAVVAALSGFSNGNTLNERAGSALVAAPIGALVGAGAQKLSNVGAARATRAALDPVGSTTLSEVRALTDATGIPVMTSDVRPPRTFMGKASQALGERIPFAGTGGKRAAQQVARQEAVQDVLSEYGGMTEVPAIEGVMADLSGQRGAQLERWTKVKTQIKGQVAEAGPVPVPRALEAIDGEIARLQSIGTDAAQTVVGKLENWKKALHSQGIENIEEIRKEMGSAFTAPDLTHAKDAGEKALNAIYGPLREDITDFIGAAAGKGAAARWQAANRNLAQMAGELKMGRLKSVLRSGEATPEDVSKLLFSSKPSEVRALYTGLSDQGRANARTAIMQQVFKKLGGEVDNISPDRFLTIMKQVGNSAGVFFDGADATRVQGLVRALQITRRAGQSGVHTSTGQQAVPYMAVSGFAQLFGGGIEAAGAMGTVGGAARIYESKLVRNALLRLARTEPGTEAEARAYARLQNGLASQSAAIENALGVAANDNSAVVSGLAAKDRDKRQKP